MICRATDHGRLYRDLAGYSYVFSWRSSESAVGSHDYMIRNSLARAIIPGATYSALAAHDLSSLDFIFYAAAHSL